MVFLVVMGVVLGRWLGGGPWFGGLVGCLWLGQMLRSLYVAVFRVQGTSPPLGVGRDFSFSLQFILALAQLAFSFQPIK